MVCVCVFALTSVEPISFYPAAAHSTFLAGSMRAVECVTSAL